mgnify:CR=1 FL=1
MMRGLEKFNKLVEAFEKLPTVGRKSAVRFAYHLVLNDTFSAMKLANAIESAIKSIRKCERCGALSEHEICDICLDDRRDVQKLCMVESAKDIFVLEEHKLFDGRYFVLSDLEEETLEKLESIHIPMPAPLKTILQLITFYSMINIRRRQRVKVTAD